MQGNTKLIFKVASESWEFEQIHELNYQTFVEEIPQHRGNTRRMLIDKYHKQNTYVICLCGKELLGMIALRDKRPLSLDMKLENLDSYLPPFKTILEYRLLAVKKERRNSAIFTGIMRKSYDMAVRGGYDIAVISGTTRQARLYKHLGFKPFGPMVGEPPALFQPMYMDIAGAMRLRKQTRILRGGEAEVERLIFNYLPGPVSIRDDVLEASANKPDSHRSSRFVQDFNDFRHIISRKLNAHKVQIMTGSGTLANDVVAAQLSVLSVPGLLLVNGEFGKRLRDHALRAGLVFDVIYAEPGRTFDSDVIEKAIDKNPGLRWIWAVHCETSTGVINDIDMLRRICRRHRVKLCLDAVSSIGSCQVDLSGIHMATAVSGKGIGSLPGLAMVFYHDEIICGNRRPPKYFDLAYYESKQGIPFTISSNAVYAVMAAVENSDWLSRFERVGQWSRQLCDDVEAIGLRVLAEKHCRAPHITTIVLPESISSMDLGKRLEDEGILVSYRSEYLVSKNHIQICFMGECERPTPMLTYFLRQAVTQSGKTAHC